MSKKERRRFTAREKAELLKQNLFENKPVSQICDEHGIQPTVFHRWKQQTAENLAAAFEKRNNHEDSLWQKKALKLERKLAQKNEVLSELMEEHVALLGSRCRVQVLHWSLAWLRVSEDAEKKSWGGGLRGEWVPHDIRDQVMDFVNRWKEKTHLKETLFKEFVTHWH